MGAGRCKQWKVSLTKDGVHYLEHGDYPPQEQRLLPALSTLETPRRSGSTPAPASQKPKVRGKGPTVAMMEALLASSDKRIEIEYDEHRRYEQLAKTAERFNKIPEGMQVTVESDWRKKIAFVWLHPLPEWRIRVLDPVTVPASLHGASEVIKKLRVREDFEISPGEKNRALRLAQALVAEAERRGHSARLIKPPSKDRWGYVQKQDRNQGHFMLVLGPDEYRLSIIQIEERKEHIASKSELARAGRGYVVPQWDYIPTERLIIRIETHGVSFWGREWKDATGNFLEGCLAQLLQELELRHEAEEGRRESAERARIEREGQWEVARERAVHDLIESHRSDELLKQVKKWKKAAEIRTYVEAIERQASTYPDEELRRSALEWAQWARVQADRIDPLLKRLRLPKDPEFTEKALQPFMGRWSAYGPESTYRG